VRLFGPTKPVAAALVVLSTVGVVPLAARGLSKERGGDNTAIVLTFVLGIMAAFVSVPMSRFLLSAQANVVVPPGPLLFQLLLFQVVPLVLGALLARTVTRARAIVDVVSKVNVVVLLLALVLIIAPRAGAVLAIGARGVVLALVFALGLAAIAFAVGGPTRQERRAIVGISNRANIGLALAIIASAGVGHEFTVAVIGVFLVRFLVGVFASALVNRRYQRQPRARAPATV
jgi:ACR3 family arsenite efflux pump ArsB